jgi:hypothetical protein
MNEDLKRLIRLQAVDNEIAVYRARINAFPEKSRAMDVMLESALVDVETAKAAIKASQVRRKEHEATVTDVEGKISKYRDQLMSVKTNEEYKAMTREIEFSQEKVRKEEDQILAIMENAEVLEGRLAKAEAVLNEDEAKVSVERVELEKLNQQDQKTLSAYEEERTALVGDLAGDVIAHYERVRKARGGVAVARASGEGCVVCHVKIRPQRFQEVRRNDSIITCDSCGRILYAPENMDHPFEVA